MSELKRVTKFNCRFVYSADRWVNSGFVGRGVLEIDRDSARVTLRGRKVPDTWRNSRVGVSAESCSAACCCGCLWFWWYLVLGLLSFLVLPRGSVSTPLALLTRVDSKGRSLVISVEHPADRTPRYFDLLLNSAEDSAYAASLLAL